MKHPQQTFIGTDHCGLCCGRFPSSDIRDKQNAWQSNFRAVLCLGLDRATDENAFVVTKPALLPDLDEEICIPLLGHPHIELVSIRRGSQCEEVHEQVAHCFHSWCYEVLLWRVQQYPKTMLYKLLRTLMPDHFFLSGFATTCFGSNYKIFLERANEYDPSFKLPLELRARIWDDVGLSAPYSAFMLVVGETSRLAQSLMTPSSPTILLEKGSSVSVEMISVFGTDYIRKLVEKSSKTSLEIPGAVTELRFSGSRAGICAVKLSGTKWETAWLGKIPQAQCTTWYGMERMKGPTVFINYNDLNCIHISGSERTRSQILWDQPDFPSSLIDADAALFDFNRDVLAERQSEHTIPRRLFFRYLSLYAKSQYISGLTIYVRGSSITGLEAHFNEKSRLSGTRNGCALHLPLHYKERIIYTWLRIVNSSYHTLAAPGLVVQTSLGRRYCFGPYILPSLVVKNQYRWIRLESQGFISGFYHEASSSITRLGIVSDGTHPAVARFPPQYHHCDFPRGIGGPGAGLFLTTAELSAVGEVDLCRVSGRCTGILIKYQTRPPVVLGQWCNSSVSRRSRIHVSHDFCTCSVYFKVDRYRDYNIVTDIIFSNPFDQSLLAQAYQGFNTGQHIAWWFSEIYDQVSRWHGKFLSIPGGTSAS